MRRIVRPIFLLMVGLASPAMGDEARFAYNNHCRTCHSLKDGDNRHGPSLAGIVGQEAGRNPSYPYSSAFRNAGFIWTHEKMDAFLENPDQTVPGNNMNPFQGISDPAIRALLIEALSG